MVVGGTIGVILVILMARMVIPRMALESTGII